MNDYLTISFPDARPGGGTALRTGLDAYRPGYALPQIFYSDPEIFRTDMRHFVMAHWHCVGHASMIREPGDFFTVDIGGESIIVVRGQDEQVRALVNVCRHRGSRVCTERQGTVKGGLFVCPYHAWTYDCSGALQRARSTPDAFPKEDYALRELALRICEGVIFITFAGRPLGFDHVADSFGRFAKFHAWAGAKVGATRMYTIQANWKLVNENYSECYHCGPAHQEYSKRHVFARPQAQRVGPDQALHARDAEFGIALEDAYYLGVDAQPGQESASAFRSALADGCLSGSRDGKPVAPLMGAFKGKRPDGGHSFFDVGPTSNFIAYPDYGLIYRTIPLTPETTGFELMWLVDKEAVAGRDFREEDLVWLWDHTSAEDKKIVELNQAGVNSIFYRPGPYTPMEFDTDRYVLGYIEEMRKA